MNSLGQVSLQPCRVRCAPQNVEAKTRPFSECCGVNSTSTSLVFSMKKIGCEG
jgi:hypothetical protein